MEPHLGGYETHARPHRWWFSAPTFVVVGGMLLAALYVCFKASENDARQADLKAAATAEAHAKAEKVARLKEAIGRLSSGADTSALSDCKAAAVEGVELPDAAKVACRDAFASDSARAAKANDVTVARSSMKAAIQAGLAAKKAAELGKSIASAERRMKADAAARKRRDEALQAKADAVERVAYGVILRERFLDHGEDIKVWVYGEKKDHITLEWVMFNDVWTHRMAKSDGIIADMQRLGFRRVDVVDGYDYHVYWDLDGERR
jgi:hypothetical protein